MRTLVERMGAGWVMVWIAAHAAGVFAAETQSTRAGDLLITIVDFAALHASGRVLAVDVRGVQSFATGHIPGAVHVAAPDVRHEAAALGRAAAGRLVVTYCSCPDEASSLFAADVLTGLGVPAKALAGGLPGWIAAGGVVEKSGRTPATR